MARAKGVVTLTEQQRAILERLSRSRTEAQRLVERAQIILMSAEDRLNVEQAEEIGVNHQRIRRWRCRWADRQEGLAAAEAEGASTRDLEALIIEVLSDDYRSGTPPRITPEQIAQIIAVGCEQPSECGRPVSHWTPRELADEVVKRGIVDRISPRHVARFFGGGRSEAAPVPLLAQRQDQGRRSRGVRRGRAGGLRGVRDGG